MQYLLNFDALEESLVDCSPSYSRAKDEMHKVGVPRYILLSYVIAALLITVCGFIWFFSGMQAITQGVAFIHPAWQTIKAVKTKQKDDDTFWLSYWVLYGAINMFDSIVPLGSFIPMYELMKTIFYFWLWNSNTKGVEKLYPLVVQPICDFLERFEKIATDVFSTVREEMNKTSASKKEE
jgi:receptor expression-enhancing protein 5/6